MISKIVFVVALLVLIFLYIRYLEFRTMFVPYKNITTTPDTIGLEYEDIYFNTSDGIKLNGWLVKNPESNTTLIFTHGNAGNISDRLQKISFFIHLGLNVFIFDYRGYGNSKGVPSEQGIYTDALAAYDYIKSRKDVDNDKIVIYGASLGGAVAVDLASKRELAAVILDSTFSSGSDMAKYIFPIVPDFLVSVKLNSASKIKNVKAPKLFIHSIDDEIVPYKLGRKLFEMAKDPKEFAQINGDHNDGFILSEDKFRNSTMNFLKGLNLIK